MVRVVCVHHFTRQDVSTLDDSAGEYRGCCEGPGDWLLVAREHRIDIRDLGNGAVEVGGFSTVDTVQQLHYCEAGNFVVTLESKPARPNYSDHTYVRVYLNWDKQTTARPPPDHKTSEHTEANIPERESQSLKQSVNIPPEQSRAEPYGNESHSTESTKSGQCNLDPLSLSSEVFVPPPMRARIAGRVTPSGQSVIKDSLEMVEIPLKKPAMFVNVCQATGNIIVVSGMSLSVFKFIRKVLDASRLQYIDFDEILEIDVGFYVREAALLEDLVGCVSDREAHVFQIVNSKVYYGKSGKNAGKADDGDDEKPMNYSFNEQRRKSSSTPDVEQLNMKNQSKSHSNSRSKSNSRSMSHSPGRLSNTNGEAKLNGGIKPMDGGGLCSGSGVRVADCCLDLSTADWSDMVPYGTAPVTGAVHRALPGGHQLVLLPSLLCNNTAEPAAGGASGAGRGSGSRHDTEATHKDSGEHLGPTRSNHISPVRIKLLSGSGQRITTGVFHAITLIHRRMDLPYPPPSPPYSTTPDSSAYISPTQSFTGSDTVGGGGDISGGRGSLGGVGGGSDPQSCPVSMGLSPPQWNTGVTAQMNTDVPFSNLKLMPVMENKGKGAPQRRSSHPLLSSCSPRDYQQQQQQQGCYAPVRVGASVFFSSPTTGFLYHVTLAQDPFKHQIIQASRFHYTSAAACVVLEPSLLHALTLTGLETYTRPPHPAILTKVLPTGVQVKVAGLWAGSSGGSGVGGCLVGLRPFLNVHSLALTQSCLALVASPGDTPKCNNSAINPRLSHEETIYSLHRPTAASLYKEMLRVGHTHYGSSPPAYLHLLLEAFMVVLVQVYGEQLVAPGGAEVVVGADKPSDNGGGGEKSGAPGGSGGDEVAFVGGIEECMKLKMAGKQLDEMESNKYFLESPKEKSVSKGKVAKESRRRSKERKPSEERRKKRSEEKHREVEEEIGKEDNARALIEEAALLLADYYAVHGNPREWEWSLVGVYRGFQIPLSSVVARLSGQAGAAAALVYTLTTMLTAPQTSTLPAAQANIVLEALEKLSPESVSEVLLRSTCLRDYKKDKVLSVLKNELSRQSPPRPRDVLALATIIMDRGSPDQVSTVLGLLRSHELLQVLQEHYHLLVKPAPPIDEDNGVGTVGSGGGGATLGAMGTMTPSAPSTPRALVSSVVLTPLALILMDYKWDIFCEVFIRLIDNNNNTTSNTLNNSNNYNTLSNTTTLGSPYNSSATSSCTTFSSALPPLTLDMFCGALMEQRPVVTCGPECNVNSLRLRDFMEAFFMEYGYQLCKACEERSGGSGGGGQDPPTYGRSVSMLVSLYLASLLGAFTPKSRDELIREEQRQAMVGVYGPRPNYLNLLSPFNGGPAPVCCNNPRVTGGLTSTPTSPPGHKPQESTGNKVSKSAALDGKNSDRTTPIAMNGKSINTTAAVTQEDNKSWSKSASGATTPSGSSGASSGNFGASGKKSCNCVACSVNLLILQSLLSSPLPSSSDRRHVARFLSSNPAVVGSEALLASCLTGPQQLNHVLANHPHAFLVYAKGVCSTVADWRAVVKLLCSLNLQQQQQGQRQQQQHQQQQKQNHGGKAFEEEEGSAKDVPYEDLLEDVLTELSSLLSFHDFLSVLPSDVNTDDVTSHHAADVSKNNLNNCDSEENECFSYSDKDANLTINVTTPRDAESSAGDKISMNSINSSQMTQSSSISDNISDEGKTTSLQINISDNFNLHINLTGQQQSPNTRVDSNTHESKSMNQDSIQTQESSSAVQQESNRNQESAKPHQLSIACRYSHLVKQAHSAALAQHLTATMHVYAQRLLDRD